MALINLKVDLTDPVNPKITSDDVLNLFPGDRLQFESNPPGTPIAVNLGTTLLALVKNAGLNMTPGNFVVSYTPGGAAIVEDERPLDPDAQGAPPDPPS